MGEDDVIDGFEDEDELDEETLVEDDEEDEMEDDSKEAIADEDEL